MEKKAFQLTTSYLKNNKKVFGNALFWHSINELTPMQIPLLTGLIVDGLSSNQALIFHIRFDDSYAILQFSVFCMIFLAIIYGISSYACNVSIAKLSRAFVSELRKQLIQKIAYMSLETHHRFGSGDLIGRTLQDTNATRAFMEKIFVKTFTTFLRATYPLIMLFLINIKLTLVALSILVPQRLISNYLEKKLHRGTQRKRKTDSDLISVIKENIDGMETIHSVNGYQQAIERAFNKTEQLEKNTLYNNRITAMIKANVWFLTSIGLGVTWWQGGLYVIDGEMSLGTLIIFTSFVGIIYTPFRRFTNIVKTYRSGIVSLERIQEILEIPSSIIEIKNAKPLKLIDARIEFYDVHFSYGTKEVLTNINLNVHPNQLLAVVGPSGSGKSSLIKLIGRLYDPSEGQIIIDGQCLKTISLNSLRSQIAIVTQRPMLFTGTILENLIIAKPNASINEIKSACEKASALTFIENLKEGFDTMLGPTGVGLSGGEAQRIGIARAILRSPKILILDEPTSSLDVDSDTIIIKALLRLSSYMTVILTSHNIRTIKFAHQIIIMEKGHIIDIGTHHELLVRSETYREYFIEMTEDISHAV